MQTFFQSVVDTFAQLQRQDAETNANGNSAPTATAPAATSWAKSVVEAAEQLGGQFGSLSRFYQPKVRIKVPSPCVTGAIPAVAESSGPRLDVWRQRWTDLEQQGYGSDMIAEAVKRAIRKFHHRLVEDPPTLPPPPSYDFVLDRRRADFAVAVQQDVDSGGPEYQPILNSVRHALLKSILSSTDDDLDSEAHLLDFWGIYLYQYERFLEESLCNPPYTDIIEQLGVIEVERKAEMERNRMMNLRVANLKQEVAEERMEKGSEDTIRPIISSWIKSGEEKLTSLLNNPVQPAHINSAMNHKQQPTVSQSDPPPVGLSSSADKEHPGIPEPPPLVIDPPVAKLCTHPRETELVQQKVEPLSDIAVEPDDVLGAHLGQTDSYRIEDEDLDAFEKELGL